MKYLFSFYVAALSILVMLSSTKADAAEPNYFFLRPDFADMIERLAAEFIPPQLVEEEELWNALWNELPVFAANGQNLPVLVEEEEEEEEAFAPALAENQPTDIEEFTTPVKENSPARLSDISPNPRKRQLPKDEDEDEDGPKPGKAQRRIVF